jgi:hypothetical protein
MSKLAAVCIVAIPLLWSAALASAAGVRHYLVQYSGTGTYKSTTETQTSPECGEVDDKLTENTSFSWFTTYNITIGVARHRISSGGDKSQSMKDSDKTNDQDMSGVISGCQSGTYDCHGTVDPADGDSELSSFSAGAGGSSKFDVEAVSQDGFTGRDFGGTWDPSLDPFNCDEYDDLPALTGIFRNPNLDGGVGPLFKASFPVKYATWLSLPKGHYFKVDVKPGHYAPKPEYVCYQVDGCDHESLDWSGVVKVRRYS